MSIFQKFSKNFVKLCQVQRIFALSSQVKLKNFGGDVKSSQVKLEILGSLSSQVKSSQVRNFGPVVKSSQVGKKPCQESSGLDLPNYAYFSNGKFKLTIISLDLPK